MKKIFTHLFVVLLLSFVTVSNVWAQETTEISLNFSEGTCNSTGGVYCYSWTSTTDPAITVSVGNNMNNLVVNPSSSNFEMHEGANGSTWTFSVTGYRIVSYSFTYKTKQTGNDVTITIGETTYTSSDSEQSLEIAGLDSPTASFSLSGSNKGVVVSNLKLNVYKHSSLTALEEGQVYMFENARAARSLRANGTSDVHVKATAASDLAQQWYVTKEGEYYVLRNIACGKYLKGALSNAISWGMTDDYSATENKFELHTSNYETLNTLKTNGSNDYGYMHDDGNGDNGGYNVVGWLNGNTNTGSHWTITKVDYTTEEITALLEKAPTTAELAGYTTALGELFSDVACVTPKLASLSAAQTSDAYDALPSALQAMVDKVYNEITESVALETAWAENNADDEKSGWSGKYAKKFRVQMYEPYSIAGDITSWLGINAHANNDNPTGIHVPEAGTLYVMVEGTINDGASLRIVDGGHNWRVTNATGGGYALKPGLNVINYTEATGMLYVCYNVDTYNPDGTDDATRFPHKLSEYAPLKIHIEGGAVNGYYNACGDFRATAQDGSDNLWKTISGANVDCDEDWVYMETRANLNVLPVLGHRQILLFHLEDWEGNRGMKTLLPDLVDVPTEPYSNAELWSEYEGMGLDASTGKINIMMEAWDRIMYSELATMGLVSEATMKRMNELYPRWENDYTVKHEMYDYENKSSIDGKDYLEFCGVDYSDVFNHHGVALGTESGYMYGGWDHCGYHINTYGGIVQNMANNAGSTWGPAHEIGHQHQALLTLNGLTEVTNNLFSNIALWYKGMSTSRYNGSNGSLESVLNAYNTEGSDIYTNNIWALTHLYYRLWLYYHLAGNNTQFYPRLFELLRHEPMQKGYNVSGDVSTLHFYKLACQAAGEDLTEFFRAHGYFSIMDDRLVGDYSNSVYEVSQEMIDEAIAEVKEMGYEENLAIIFICDDDENATYVQHDGVTKRDIYGETTSNSDFGSVSDFINGNVSVETAYTATVSTDGVVTMSGGEGGVGFLVLNEDGELVSFSNKSTFAISDEAAYLLATGKASVVTVDTESTTTEAEVDVTAMRFALLQELIENAIALTQNTSETRVGFYKSSAVENLQEYVTMAQEVIANGDLANLQAVYELLYAEYNAVVANEFSRVPLVPGSKYAILAKTNDRILSFSDTNVVTVAATEDYATTANNQWYVERDGAFHIKNAGNSKYIQNVTDQNGVLYTVGDEVVNMNINEIQLGCYSIATSTVPGRYMNMDGANNARVITWGDTGNNSQWKFILLEKNETNAAKEELLELAKKTLALVDVVGTVEYTEGNKIELQSTNSGNANYIWSNAAVQGNDVDKLLDGNKDSFFHSQWNNSTAPADGWGHHLTVDLGENPSLTSFKFKFTTRNQSNLSNYPKTIEVYGSNVGGNDVANYTKLQVASGFATGAGVDNEAVVMGNGTAYRYLRFLVTDASGSNAGTNTGADGKVFFHMSEFSLYPITVTTSVKSDYTSGVTSDAVMNAFVDAEQAKSVYNNASATIDDINAKKTELGDGTAAGSYTTLLTQYNNVLASVVNAKKEQLKELMDNTATLIESVGEVEITNPVPVELSGKLYAHTPYTAGGENHSDYSSAANNYNLLDGDPTTYFHSDYSANKPAVPYIRVDLGAGNEVKEFSFNYKTRDNGNNCPTEIVIEGSNDEGGDGTYTVIATLTKDANGLPVVYDTFKSQTITSDVPYRYIRFKVTASESTGFFVMSEFGFTKGIQVSVTITGASGEVTEDLLLDTYLQNAKAQNLYDTSNSVDLLDAMIVDLQAAYDKLYAATNNTADLKNELNELISQAEELHRSIIDLYGDLNPYYSNVIAHEDFLDFLEEMENASGVANSNESTADEIKAAYNELKKVYDDIQEVKSNDYAGDRGSITDLIEKMEALLGEVADKTTAKTAIALQVDDEEREFYIWSNATASDCDGIGALIDKNDDASAKTGTFFGTVWQGGAVTNYSHYITVDLGTEIALSELSIDYTTRNSTHANQRPTAIKVLGSNDKEGEYVEITHLSEGMPVGQCAKWEMDGTVALNGYYRYIRFAVATEMGYFNMSDFNLYAHSALVTNSNYQPAGITGEQLYAMNVALLDGIAARDKFVTEDNYNAAVTALQAQYDALLAIKNANKTDKDELETLVTETNELVTEVATVNDTETSITMQCTDENASYYLYCNAPGKTNNYGGDNLGVAALLDNDSNTFLHTTYNGNDYADDLDHYLRLDMGENEALAAFKFNYVGRVGNTGNAPKTIVIEGSNDRENFEEITTLKNLPTADNATYQSDVITNGKAYRYIRFMVTETSNGSDHNGHDFFALSHFSVTACKTISVAQEYASPNLPLSTLVTANNEVVDGTTVKEQFYVTQDLYDSTVAELQAAKDALAAAIALKNIPVKLTTDVNNPVLYKIKINRSTTTVLEYDGATADATKQVAVADEYVGNKYQAWYFMQGTDTESNDDILILPYWNEGAANTALRLAAASTGNAAAAVWAVESGDASKTLQNWYITVDAGNTAEGWWNIRPQGKDNYFSNNGGVGNKMGFWNNSSDDGSEFQFVLDETDYSLSDAYYALYNQYVACGGEAASGTVIGTYTVESATAYNDAYNNAAVLLEAKNSTDDEYNDARTALADAFAALEYNGGLCKIRSAYTGGYSADNLVYVNAEGKSHFEAATDEQLSKYIWEFIPVTGGYHLKSLHTQSYITAAGWGEQVVLGEEAAAKLVTVDFLDKENGIVRLNVAGGYPLHAQNSGSKLVGYKGDLGTASAWYVEKVENVEENIKHTVSLGADESGSGKAYSTLYLGYNATIPEGVTASVVTEINEIGQLVMEEVTGEILPAKTAVVLSGENAGGAEFKYADGEPSFSTEDNILKGTTYTKVVHCGDTSNIYMLAKKSGRVAFYWTYENCDANGNYVYINANEEVVEKDTEGAHKNHNKGGYVKCNANKAYLQVSEGTQEQAAAAMFGFHFGGNTTDIDSINAVADTYDNVYDLQGRKLEEITSPGIYIVNGKKVLVK